MSESDAGFCPMCKSPVYDGIGHDCSTWSRNTMLDCPECETPAVSASSVINGRPAWTEDDAETWCPGCGCLLRVFLTGDCQSQWCEARVSEYSGRDWRRAIEGALGVDDVPDEHTPDQLADIVLKQREVGNMGIGPLQYRLGVARDALRGARDALDSLMGDSDLDGDDSPEFRALRRASAALKEMG